MQIKWTQHIKDPDEKSKFEALVRNAKPVLERLRDIVNEDYEVLNKMEISKKVYEIPNWDYKQAHINGYKEHTTNILKLINLDQQKDKNK